VYKLHIKNRGKMPCYGICIHHKTYGRYADGHKRCNNCNLFIKWEGSWCPCCGYKLRTKPRHSKFKAKLREQKRIELTKKLKNNISCSAKPIMNRIVTNCLIKQRATDRIPAA
jgi:hypothetical protein